MPPARHLVTGGGSSAREKANDTHPVERVLDIAAIVDAVVRVSWLAADLGPRLGDLEVNPLIVRRAGRGAVAVDARARLEELST